jgi:hypothetical protein
MGYGICSIYRVVSAMMTCEQKDPTRLRVFPQRMRVFLCLRGSFAAVATVLAVVRIACAMPPSEGAAEQAFTPADDCAERNLCSLRNFAFGTTDALRPAMRETPVPLQKRAWEAAWGGQEAARPHIRARLMGWPQQALIAKATLPQTDAEFVRRLARDTWNGLAALTDRENGLPIDNIRVTRTSVALADAHIGDYTSGTNIGLYLAATAAAQDLALIDRAQALERIRKVLDTLDRLENYQGLFFNFYDTTSLERTSNFVSFVDSAWLAAGLIVVRTSFPELAERSTALLDRTHFGFFYDSNRRLISHGYYVNLKTASPFDYGVLYTEARLGTLIAIGKGDIPDAPWFEMVRTFPTECTGQALTPQATRIKSVNGHQFPAGYYEWAGMQYVPSWGGSMFEALMPTLLLDEMAYAPKSLGINGKVHALVQARYALERLRYQVWGLSPSATPTGDSYTEYGVRVLGSQGYGAGSVTPHASALALAVTPEAALGNLRTLAALYDIYGEYGFYDAVDPSSGTVAYKYLTLDQAMLFLAVANHLSGGSIPKRFASDPIIRKVMPLIGAEDFFDGHNPLGQALARR